MCEYYQVVNTSSTKDINCFASSNCYLCKLNQRISFVYHFSGARILRTRFIILVVYHFSGGNFSAMKSTIYHFSGLSFQWQRTVARFFVGGKWSPPLDTSPRLKWGSNLPKKNCSRLGPLSRTIQFHLKLHELWSTITFSRETEDPAKLYFLKISR